MLSSLKPTSVWNLFSQICQIPHPSEHEEAIAQFIIDFAKTHAIECETDAVGNILLRQKASAGMEEAPSIVLQAHMDMVPQKNAGVDHNFLTDPIKPYIDGDWVTATETTLGADNGVGLASALAVLIEPDLAHGPLEVLVTRTEETGMVGAFALQPNWIQSHYLLNTDSEEEGEVFIGCAGGIDVQSRLPLHYDADVSGHDRVKRIALKGLRGGHSGCDIDKGRGNAILLLARFLDHSLETIPYRLIDFKGGSLRNAIPREAFAEIIYPADAEASLMAAITHFETTLRNELSDVEPNIQMTSEEITSLPSRILTIESQRKLIQALRVAPNGVMRMSQALRGVVETSLNIGVVTIEDDHLMINFLIRSQLDSAKADLVDRLIAFSGLIGAICEVSGNYSGWAPDHASHLLALAKTTYEHLTGQPPKFNVIHAGLECGLFKQSYPMMDMISIGPTIVSPHSPDEKVNIASVERYWQWLTAILSNADRLPNLK